MPKISQSEFDQLIDSIRDGDQAAATRLVELYEPEIRREVRLRLSDPQLRRTFDSTDICQSVFGNFFVRTAIGQFEFDRPEQLLRLLSQMVRNKVIDRHRREKVRQPRDGNAILYGDMAVDFSVETNSESPSQIVAKEELMSKIEQQLSEQEKKIAGLRRNGLSWDEIAENLGESADALRKRLSRACDRILNELHLNE